MEMKRIGNEIKLLFLLIMMILVVGCFSEETKIDLEKTKTEITVLLDSEITEVTSSNAENIILKYKIKDGNGNIIYSMADIYVNEAKINTYSILGSESGEYIISINVEDVSENESGEYIIYAKISDVKSKNLVLSKENIVEDAVVDKIKLSLDKTKILSNGNDEVTLNIQVIDQFGKTMTDIPKIYSNNNLVVLVGNKFRTDKEGTYVIYAKIGNIESEKITLVASDVEEIIEIDILIGDSVYNFDKNIYSYELSSVDNSVETISLEIKEFNSETTYKINNSDWKSYVAKVNLDLNEGENILEVKINELDVKSYTYKIKRKSLNMSLSKIEIDGIVQELSSDVIILDSVLNDTEMITILLEKLNDEQEVRLEVNGKGKTIENNKELDIDLKVGDNVIKVLVNPLSGEDFEYTLNIRRLNGNTELSELTLDDKDVSFGDEIKVDGELKKIELLVRPVDEENGTIKIQVNDKDEEVIYSKEKNLDGEFSIELLAEETKVKITVLAEDGTKKEEGIITIIKKSTDLGLESILINNKNIDLDSTIKMESVDNLIKDISLEIKKKSDDQEVKIILNDGTEEELDSNKEVTVNLDDGDNTLEIEVSLDGKTNTYTIEVIRKLKNTDLELVIFDRVENKPENNVIDLGSVSEETFKIFIKPIVEEKNNSVVKQKLDGKLKILNSDGELELELEKLGLNEFTLVVISEDVNETEDYTVKVFRLSGENGLGSISFGEQELELSENSNDKIKVNSESEYLVVDDKEFTIKFEKNTDKSKVFLEEDGEELTEDTYTFKFDEFGDNSFELFVESEDGKETLTYEINVDLKENKPMTEIENMNIEFIDSDEYKITFDESENAITYSINYSDEEDGEFDELVELEANEIEDGYETSKLKDGNTYYFYIITKNDLEQELKSKNFELKTEIEVEDAPEDIEIEVSSDSLDISWEYDDIEGILFKVYIDDEEVKDGIEDTEVTIDGLEPNTKYEVVVAAYNPNIEDNEEKSDGEDVTTDYGTTTEIKSVTLDYAEDSFIVLLDGATTKDYVLYQGDKESESLEDYDEVGEVIEIEYEKDFGATQIKEVAKKLDLEYGETYYFIVVVDGKSKTKPLKLETPIEVSDIGELNHDNNDDDNLTIYFEEVLGATGYNVYYDGKFVMEIPEENKGQGSVYIKLNSTDEAGKNKLKPDTSYEFEIQAYNNYGSIKSKKKTFKTLKGVGKPVVTNFYIDSDYKMNLEWDSSDNADAYDIQIKENGNAVFWKKAYNGTSISFNDIKRSASFEVYIRAYKNTTGEVTIENWSEKNNKNYIDYKYKPKDPNASLANGLVTVYNSNGEGVNIYINGDKNNEIGKISGNGGSFDLNNANLDPGTYTIYVYTYENSANSDGIELGSYTKVAPKPSAPSFVSVEMDGAKMTIQWGKVENVEGYKIKVGENLVKTIYNSNTTLWETSRSGLGVYVCSFKNGIDSDWTVK